MNDTIRILVIDDSEDDRMLYRRTLQKSTDALYQVIESENGDNALNLIEDNKPDCVLLDYSLPGRNGLEVLKFIRNQYPFVPVVMMTGQGNEAVAVKAMQEGAQNYIAKSSITPEALQRVIRVAIEHCALTRRIHEQRTSLEVFTRALAHDLKEPVRTIRSFVELIAQQEGFTSKAQGYFKHIQNAADRMHMLIDMVYFYTRLDDPRQGGRENCDAGTVLTEVKENLDRLIRERSATITSGALPEIHGNRAQMIQLLQNLITNAIRHSDQPVHIHVEAQEQGDQWLFSVKDNGPGIEEAYFRKIFDPFKRLTNRDDQGAGLGLAICRRIVESHEGKIWCQSKPGEGATFLFTLPKRHEEAAQALPSAHLSADAPLQPMDIKPLANVLIVDDSKADIEITRFRLERSGLQCNLLVARNGEEALMLLRRSKDEKKPVDLVLLDINMPEMDGFELLEHIRADAALKDLAVVMCTGSIYDKDMERSRELGATGYLTKPIEFARLKQLLETNPDFRLYKENDGFALRRAA